MRALIAIFATLVLSLILAINYPDAMIKPGRLSEDHQLMNRDCMKCHVPFQGVYVAKCTSCHKPEQIGKLKVDGTLVSAAGHSNVAFHQQLATTDCTGCHIVHLSDPERRRPTAFRHDLLTVESSNNCASCHSDKKPVNEMHQRVGDRCLGCHNTTSWTPATFNHQNVASGDLSCSVCHEKDRPKDDSHRQAISNNCVACHRTDGWRPATFDHQQVTSGNANCVDCHQKDRPADDLPRQSTNDCVKCHGTRAWRPSSFDHSSYFQFDRNHPSNCASCHIMATEFKSYSCYNCHEHSRAGIAAKHIREGIGDFENCVRCHRTGNEHDGERGERKTKHGERGEDDDHE